MHSLAIQASSDERGFYSPGGSRATPSRSNQLLLPDWQRRDVTSWTLTLVGRISKRVYFRISCIGLELRHPSVFGAQFAIEIVQAKVGSTPIGSNLLDMTCEF